RRQPRRPARGGYAGRDRRRRLLALRPVRPGSRLRLPRRRPRPQPHSASPPSAIGFPFLPFQGGPTAPVQRCATLFAECCTAGGRGETFRFLPFYSFSFLLLPRPDPLAPLRHVQRRVAFVVDRQSPRKGEI